jgi:alkylation response protein AidB-like acyl-CoA dehydrogenase
MMTTTFPLPGDLSEEARLFAEAARRWAEREALEPRRAKRLDDAQRARALGALLVELGLQEHALQAGAAPDAVALSLALGAEEAGRVDVGLAAAAASTLATVAAVASSPASPAALSALAARARGTEPLRIALALPAVDGTPRAAARRAEVAGWTVGGTSVRALCSALSAPLLGVVCDLDGEESGLFAIPADGPGVRRGPRLVQTGLDADADAALELAAVQLPEEALLLRGVAVAGLVCWLQLQLAAACAGALRAAHDILVDWAEHRVIKGRGQRFADNSLCASLLGEVAQRALLGRWLVLDLARLVGRAACAPETRVAALCVVHELAASAEEGLHRAMELMGSAGYAREWHLERYWRDVKVVRGRLGGQAFARVALARHFHGSRGLGA